MGTRAGSPANPATSGVPLPEPTQNQAQPGLDTPPSPRPANVRPNPPGPADYTTTPDPYPM